jgi:hypothetical protein
MPNLAEDLEPGHWGERPDLGITWIWAYEEDPDAGPTMPDWLLQLCIVARDTYGCNWIMLEPDGDEIPGCPTYEH